MRKPETQIARLSDALVSQWLPNLRPEKFEGRSETWLGKAVGLNQFGVNHLQLEPGAWSSFRHWHEGEDEFAYILSGEVCLIDDNGEHLLKAGDFAGFPAGVANGHHLVNRSGQSATVLVVGTRLRGHETIHYPDGDFRPVEVVRDANGDRVT